MLCVISAIRFGVETLSIVPSGIAAFDDGAAVAAAAVDSFVTAGSEASIARYERTRTASATVNATVRSVRKTGRNVGRTLAVTESSVDTTRNSKSERRDF